MGKYLDLLDRAGLYDINDQRRQKSPLWSFKSFWSYFLRP